MYFFFVFSIYYVCIFFVFCFSSLFIVCLPFLFVKISLVSIVQLVVGFFFRLRLFYFYFISFVLITWLDKDSNLNWFLIEKLNCELRICIFSYCASWFLFRFDFFKIFPWTKTCLSILSFFVCIYIINISRSWIIIICYVTTKMARRTCLVRYHYHISLSRVTRVCVCVCVLMDRKYLKPFNGY